MWSLLLGLVRGAQHALEPDHLAAVSTMVSASTRARAAAALGLAWGLGHTLALLAVGGALMVLDARLPHAVARGLELVVAGMLVLLGLLNLRRAWSGAGPAGRPHPHRHGELAHEHAAGEAHVHLGAWAGAARGRALGTRPLIVGMVHGLAGSGALTALAVGSLGGHAQAGLFLVTFCVGSVVGMAAATTVLGLALGRVVTGPWGVRVVGGAGGALSLVVGVWWGALALGG